VPSKAQERPVVSRKNRLQPVERSSEPMPFNGGPGARMQRKQHRKAQLAQLVKDGPQALRIVGVLRPVVASTYPPGSAPSSATISLAVVSSGSMPSVASTTVLPVKRIFLAPSLPSCREAPAPQ
jgi:hypothetical protein